MIFSLDIQRARQGDCLLIHYGSMNDPGLVVIDGGPAQVYMPFLKPRLVKIKKQRHLPDNMPLMIDLLMVSHIDDDHIKGVVELTSELVTTSALQKPLPFKIRELWHNTFDDIIGNSPEELQAAVTASFGEAALVGESNIEGLDPDAAKVLASAGQGFRLRDDARLLKLPINSKFDGKLIMASPNRKEIDMGKELTFTVAGPMQAELLDLQKEYDAFLRMEKEKKKKKEALASFADTSIPNLSSLVLLASAGDKKMLLTGDARGDKILQGLEMVGLLKKGGTMQVDILKMPHHGSDRNMDPSFFQRIKADHYVFSGNGGYGNPERATLQWLWDVRGNEQYKVHLTYPIDEIDANRKKDWEKSKKSWLREKHSLECFLKDHDQFKSKLSITKDDGPYVIDLLNQLGF